MLAGDFITVVSGLPRSGTSMVMRMLEAGGFELLVDGVREPDEDNPAGYYEFEPVKRLESERAWLARAVGRAVKVVSPLLPHLPADYAYRVLFLRRDMSEVLASQRVMLSRRARGAPQVESTADPRMGRLFEKHLRRVEAWLEGQDNIQTLFLEHRAVIENAAGAAAGIVNFLGCAADTEAMAGVVEPGLYRQRT